MSCVENTVLEEVVGSERCRKRMKGDERGRQRVEEDVLLEMEVDEEEEEWRE